jgi:hypothetical protein
MLRRLHRGEDGLGVVEVAMASVLTAIIMAGFYTAFISFGRNAADEQAKSDLQRQMRPNMANLVVELRQAVAMDALSDPVVELAWNKLTFTSDRVDFDAGPEEYRYYLTGPVDGYYTLWFEARYNDGSGPSFFPIAADRKVRLHEGVVASTSSPLFLGASWTGSTKNVVTSCGGAVDCDFNLVTVRWEVDPEVTRTRPENVVIVEEVRMRNAKG